MYPRICRSFLMFVLLMTLAAHPAHAKPEYGNCAACHGVPTITNFELPSSHNSLTVPITTFTASDTDRQVASLANVTGYLVSTSSETPDSESTEWSSTPPTEFTFASSGAQTLYAWVKDTVGNVSEALSDVVDILINGAPVADAGPDQNVDEGTLVTLVASNSTDPDDGIEEIAWEQIDGPAVVLSDSSSENPTFTSPDVGPDGAALTFKLTVKDFSGSEDSDSCIINVSWVNQPPVADAGSDQTVPAGQTIHLDATASSDGDDGIAGYQWQQIGGTTVQLSDDTSAQPEFTLEQVGADGESLTFELTVTDNAGLQATDTCVVNISSSAVNNPPVADAGEDQTVIPDTEVSLDGTGSTDPDDDPITYLWKQTAGTPVVLSDSGAVQPVFTAPASGNDETLEFQLTVSDASGLQSSDTCQIIIQSENTPSEDAAPTADAGPDQESPAGSVVTLDGSGSSDPEGPIESYQWVQAAGPDVVLSDSTDPAPTFTTTDLTDGDQDVVLTFELTVSDTAGQEAKDTCSVTILADTSSPGDSTPGEDGDGYEGNNSSDSNCRDWETGQLWQWVKHLWERLISYFKSDPVERPKGDERKVALDIQQRTLTPQ